MQPEKKGTKKGPNRWAVVGCALGAALLLIVANSTLWTNRYIFNSQNFTTVASTALLSESSRAAIGNEVSDRVFANRPALGNVLSDPLSKQVSAILNTNLAKKGIDRTITKLQTIMTSKNPENVDIDLSGIKANADKILAVAAAISGQSLDEQTSRVENLPDTITIVDVSKLPNIYDASVTLLWLGPIAFIGALVLLALPLIWAKRERVASSFVLLIEGGAIVVAGILAYLIGPLFKPPVLANINSINMRVVVGNVYDAFIGTFNTQSNWFFVAGGLVLISSGVVWFWPNIKGWVNRPRAAKAAK